MARSGYLVLSRRRAAAELGGRLAELEHRLRDAGWIRAVEAPGLGIWTEAAAPLDVTALPGDRGWILGAHHPFAGGRSPGAARIDPVEAARDLSRARWGRYAAVFLGPRGETAVYRDPSGHVGAAVWELLPGVDVIASDPARLPPGFRPPRMSLDWKRIAGFLAVPGAAATELMFGGIVEVGPGDLRSDADGWAAAHAVWTPATFARPSIGDPEALKPALVARVDACTAALVSNHRRAVAELSGGLDSAIVAGSLAATGEADRIAHWLNFVGTRADGDEQRYAAAVTDRIGAALTSFELSAAPLEPADFAELAACRMPAIGGADAARDRAVVRALEMSGATAVVSGQGGDAIFFQMPTALVFADALRRDGAAALRSPLLGDVARRSRTSVWTVLTRAMRLRPKLESWGDEASSLVVRGVEEELGDTRHAWVKAAASAGLPPGKALQVQAIANCHAYHGESRRAARADLIYPLLAQPVLELALGVAVPDLACAAFDRPYARDAFRDRLPQEVLDRRAKGRLSPYFGQLVAASAEGLRAFLLEGCLVDAGLLDRSVLARALDPDQLIRNGRATQVLQAAAVEAWVRHWQGQVPDAPNGWAR